MSQSHDRVGIDADVAHKRYGHAGMPFGRGDPRVAEHILDDPGAYPLLDEERRDGGLGTVDRR